MSIILENIASLTCVFLKASSEEPRPCERPLLNVMNPPHSAATECQQPLRSLGTGLADRWYVLLGAIGYTSFDQFLNAYSELATKLLVIPRVVSAVARRKVVKPLSSLPLAAAGLVDGRRPLQYRRDLAGRSGYIYIYTGCTILIHIPEPFPIC